MLAIATDGAFFPDGRHLVLRDYGRAVVYTYPGSTRSGELDLPDAAAGRGDRRRRRRRGSTSAPRGSSAPVLEVPLPAGLRAAVDAAAASRAPSPSTDRRRRPARGGQGAARGRSRRRREPWQWLLGTALVVARVVVVVRPSARADSPFRVLDSAAAASGWAHAAAAEDLARRPGLDPAAGRRRASSTSTSTASGSPTRRRSGCKRPGDPAGVAGRLGLAVRERPPAGGRHRRGRPASVPLPPGLARAGATPRSSTGCWSSARRCRGRGSGC